MRPMVRDISITLPDFCYLSALVNLSGMLSGLTAAIEKIAVKNARPSEKASH